MRGRGIIRGAYNDLVHHGCSGPWGLAYVVAIVALCQRLGTARAAECPTPSVGERSTVGIGNKEGPTSVIWENHSPVDLVLFWVHFTGQEVELGRLPSRYVRRENTQFGHLFRFYTTDSERTLVLEKRAEDPLVVVHACGRLIEMQRNMLVDGGRAAEFEKLAEDSRAPCLPENRSREWSCVKFIPKEEYFARPRELYGFATKDEAQFRDVGEVWDSFYVHHIKKMPRMTTGPGYLKMRMTERLKRLLPWFKEQRQAAMERHSVINGGYTNNHVVAIDRVNLDNYPAVLLNITLEMQQILQWWTNQQLKHTDTFGVRIYRRDSMLLNHVDRDETHMASVVLQFDQDVDEDGGWPLEVIHDNGDCSEVYLQPGELVLYEGGRFRHGRPMRLRGESFSNVFSHFAPMQWYGPDKSPNFTPAVEEAEPEVFMRRAEL